MNLVNWNVSVCIYNDVLDFGGRDFKMQLRELDTGHSLEILRLPKYFGQPYVT